MIHKHILILLALALLATVGADGGEGDDTPSSACSNKKLRGVISLVSSGAASGVGAGEMKPAAIGTKDDRPAAVYDNSQGASTQRDGRVSVDRDYYTVSDSSSGSSKATGRVDKDYDKDYYKSFRHDAPCRVNRDMYCLWTDKEDIVAMSKMNDTEMIGEFINQSLVGELGVSYKALVDGTIDYWTSVDDWGALLKGSDSEEGKVDNFSSKQGQAQAQLRVLQVMVNGRATHLQTLMKTFKSRLWQWV